MSRALAIGSVALSTRRPRVVAAGGEAELDALVAAEGADVIELRADLFASPTPAVVTAALRRLRASGRPVLLTVRAEAEGGRPLDEARRRAIYDAGLSEADAIDVEIAAVCPGEPLVERARALGRLVILSAHVQDDMPSPAVLLALVARARTLGADVTKLAALARDVEDVRSMLAVTLEAREQGVVTIAMGPAGTLSRLVLPVAGSLLTYGHVGRPTAPGQLTAAELAALLARFYPAD